MSLEAADRPALPQLPGGGGEQLRRSSCVCCFFFFFKFRNVRCWHLALHGGLSSTAMVELKRDRL